MHLVLVALPLLAAGALLALAAIAPPQPRHSYALPAVRTAVLAVSATLLVALLWSR